MTLLPIPVEAAVALAALLATATLIAVFIWAAAHARRRNLHLWLPAWLKGDWPGRPAHSAPNTPGTVHILFCVADHFEPAHNRPGIAAERERLDQWRRAYPKRFSHLRDADGRPPRHTFFYPAEDYRPEHLDKLRALARQGFGEVEVHLHHDNDTADRLRESLLAFVKQLREHGLLGSDRADNRPRFGFVHGNWALDNSLPDGRWCGVNDELRVLAQCGCYADFTLPSAPSPAQTRRINSIYYAADDPHRPKSHDDGVLVAAGGRPTGDLMIIQGPLGLRWPGTRLFGLVPVLEAGNLSHNDPPTPARADSWVRTRVCVAGRPDWTFVKVHTHGCNDKNRPVLLGDPMVRLHRHLIERYNDGREYKLHYVTAREMYNLVRAAERGLTGDPAQYTDLVISPPPCAGAAGPSPNHTETSP